MEPQTSSSELNAYSNNYAEKAWHLVAVLLSIGRPASVGELAGKCRLFSASPQLIEFLCSIPNSPILLTKNDYVLLSTVTFSAFGEFFASSMRRIQIGAREVRMLCGSVVRTYFRKRKKIGNDFTPMSKKRVVMKYIYGNEQERTGYYSTERIVDSCFEVADLQTDRRGIFPNALPSEMSIKVALWEYFSKVIYVTPSMVKSNCRLLDNQSQNDEDQGNGVKQNISFACGMHKAVILEEHADKCYTDDMITSGMPDLDGGKHTAPLLESLPDISAMTVESELEKRNLMGRLATRPLSTQSSQHDTNVLVKENTSVDGSKHFRNNRVPETRLQELAEQPFVDNNIQERVENCSFDPLGRDLSPIGVSCQIKIGSIICGLPALKEPPNGKIGSKSLVNGNPQPINQKYTQFSPTTNSVPQDDLTRKQQAALKLVLQSKVDTATKKRKNLEDQNIVTLKHKSKQITGSNAFNEERFGTVHKSCKDQHDSKSFPEFESYVVEEEEGSGGYGIVYRARRKSDGITFAIKCPHVNAHKQHVKNELKMLERFGGRNFVIKYEGSFKNGDSDCFVLEHVKHDRPEVLKREVNVFQLQWYGYCMFRALASLHKQGVFHRDVKPGNFLFSCKSNKGYLIDFNLAKDPHQKHENIADKPQASTKHVMGLQPKSTSPNKRRKILGGKSIDATNGSAPSGSNLDAKVLKRKTVDKLKAYEGLGLRNSITSQGADASGLTSAKDVTPSGERLREPLPCQGRRELINLAQEAMQSPNPRGSSIPASNRKRVAASPGIMDKKLIYLTPMPLHSSGVAISGTGSLKNRGEVKLHKEGPCVGTKGFRAPEVLLRSLHQGPKIDVWSAGVTLLYLITGKLPFTGDPEQNMKDIVKIRGNEDLWEVAKLHNRESSFPVDLLDVRYFPSMKIKEWCAANTKRPHFLDVIPGSLFDLIEKCLTVNPRLRISAEEALRHEFFTPCHEALQKHRSMRRAPTQEPLSNDLPLVRESSYANPVKAATPVKRTENPSLLV